MNIGLIGCGGVAGGHMLAYKNIEDARVVAVSDINVKKARTFAARYGIDKFFSQYVNLLEMKDLDFVDICTPTSTHVPIACDAAKFGHNVLLEKPMGRSVAECDKIISATKKHGIKLCVCHNQIFFPSIRKAKSMVDSGHLNIVSFRTTVKENPELIGAPAWNLTPEEKGILWEAGCHPAYLQLHFLKNITEIYASGSKVKYPVYDDFVVLLRTPNGVHGIIEVSWLAKEQEVIYEIDSSDGKRAKIDRVTDTLIEKSGNSKHTIGSELLSTIKKVLGHFVPARKTLKTELWYFIGHYYLISEYIKSLANDMPAPVQPEEAKRAIKLLECVEESLNKHQTVQMK